MRCRKAHCSAVQHIPVRCRVSKVSKTASEFGLIFPQQISKLLQPIQNAGNTKTQDFYLDSPRPSYIRAESLWPNDRVLQWGDLYTYVSGGFGRVRDRVVGVKHMVWSGNVTDLEGGAQPNMHRMKTGHNLLTHQHTPTRTTRKQCKPQITQDAAHKCEETDSMAERDKE